MAALLKGYFFVQQSLIEWIEALRNNPDFCVSSVGKSRLKSYLPLFFPDLTCWPLQLPLRYIVLKQLILFVSCAMSAKY